jgi:hypothetical protein
MGWISTFTDRRVDPLDPENSEFCIEDIAHALAQINRFGGHTKEPYSVGDHSLRVKEQVASMGGSVTAQIGALMHDSPEAYISDFPRPIKTKVRYCTHTAEVFPLFRSVEDVEDCLLLTIFKQLSLPWPSGDDWYLVRKADDQLLVTEARDLMHGTQNWGPLPLLREPLDTHISPIHWRVVEDRFLRTLEELQKALRMEKHI